MMCSKIIVPVDASPHSRRALSVALELAINTNAKLTILYVNEISPFYHGPLGPGSRFILEDLTAEDHLKAILADMDVYTALVSKKIFVGRPAPIIVLTAAEEKANLIVMGSRGFGQLSGLLLGSVSQSVIRLAHCPVLIVK